MVTPEKNTRRLSLIRRQLTEWNQNLALAVKTRLTLDKRHRLEQAQLAQQEINFHEGPILMTRQQAERTPFKLQPSHPRIALR